MTAYTLDNVKSFLGYDVVNGEVSLSDSEYRDVLDEVHGDVKVCGMTYGAGDVLESTDPIAFRMLKSEYESDLQSELDDQLYNEDENGVEFYVDPAGWPEDGE